MDDLEEQLEDYKLKYDETIRSYEKAKLWEKERSNLNRTIEEKEKLIRNLSTRLDEANEHNYVLQVREVDAKMEMEKKDVRFKELEKEVKKKSGNNRSVGLL
jgi:predicted RNase H-like nuclease (RuvC/YqgF family)